MTSLLLLGQGLFFDTFSWRQWRLPTEATPRSTDKDVLWSLMARDVFYFGEDRMTRIEHISYRLLMMIELLVLSGCAMTMPTMSATTTVASLSYEIPASVNAKTIVDILEESSTKVLKKPVTFDEAISDLSFANTASPVLLREKVVSLEGLGNVAIPSIICPGALASMHTLLPGQTGLRLIAGCVVGHDASTRVYLAEADTGQSTILRASSSTSLGLPSRVSSPPNVFTCSQTILPSRLTSK